MRLNEREIEECEALGYYIKYLVTSKNVEFFELVIAFRKLEDMALFMINKGMGDDPYDRFINPEELSEFFENLMQRSKTESLKYEY